MPDARTCVRVALCQSLKHLLLLLEEFEESASPGQPKRSRQMEKGYVVQGEVYAEPVLEAEVVTAEPIMGEVVGEVVPSATDHLPEALDGAPRLALVAAGSADALRFDNADVLRAGGEAPLSANGKHVGLYWPQPRNAWGHWDYIDLGCSDRVRPLRVKLEGPYIIYYSREHGEFAFDVAMWKLHEGTHLVAVKACAGNPGGPTRMSKDACGRDFVLHADGTIGPRTAQHLRFGVYVPKPPGPGKPCGPGWSAHQNIDMCGQGDVEIIHNWRATHSIEDLQRIVEQKGYSAFTVSSGQPSFGHAALKKFPYKLTAGHCKPITTCCNHPCTIYIWSGGGSGSPSGKVAPATYAENGESVSVSASLYSPATSCHLANDGSLGASAKPAPYTLEFEGPPGDGVKFRLRAPDGRYLRSDGREGTPPQWSSAADALTTAWILRVDGDPLSSPVQLKSPGNGGHEPCLCNDQPTGGWGGRVKGKWSWCPEGRGDAYWKLVKMDEVVTAEINLENELTTNQWSAGKPGGGPEAFAANPWRFNADHTFVTERDGCHGTWFVSGDKRSLRMDWQGGQRGNYAEFLRRPGFPPTCDNVGSSYGFMRSWSLTLRGGGGGGSAWVSGGSVPALERWPTAEGGEEGGGGGLQAIAGTWVPTRLGDWRGCPVGKEARVTTYKYVVQGNGDWVDELYPSHRGHVEPAEESGLYEGYGVEPGRYPAKWRLQPNGVLVAAWGDQFNVVYYLVREGDPRTATTGGAAHLNNELNDVARNTDETHRARDLVDQGADLSSTNGAPWHHTPLHQASYHGRYAMAETLVGLGAPLHLHSNPCGRGTHGTPLELARGGGHHAIAEMLTCNGGEEPVAVGGGAAPVAVGGGAAPVTSLDACVGQRCESFPNGQPGRIVETFQFTREGAIYVTTGTASGRNTYTRHGETLQHQQHAQITATLQPNGELAWSHGYGSRICGRAVARHEMDRAGGGSVKSHDMAGCWLLCGFPLFWEIARKGPVGDHPSRYWEKGCAFLLMGIPLPVDETWTRDGDTNNFRKDKNPGDVVNFSSGSCGNEKGFICKCKICP